MIVGIDIDGTITNQQEFLIKYGTLFFGHPPSTLKSNDVCTMFNCTKEDKKKFWDKYNVEYNLNCPLNNGAKELIIFLESHSIKYVFITNRGVEISTDGVNKVYYYAKSYISQIANLKSKNLLGIAFNEGGSKVKMCNNFGVTVMLEDSADMIQDLTKSRITTIKIKNNFNEDYKPSHKDMHFYKEADDLFKAKDLIYAMYISKK